MNDWKITVQNRPAEFLTDIWIYRRGPNNDTIIYRSRGRDIAEEETVTAGSASLPASFTIPTDLLPVLLQALISKGVENPEESFVQGKLVATENHLKDLRQLLKLK